MFTVPLGFSLLSDTEVVDRVEETAEFLELSFAEEEVEETEEEAEETVEETVKEAPVDELTSAPPLQLVKMQIIKPRQRKIAKRFFACVPRN